MTKLKDITTMCKAGETAQAYELARADVDASPDDVWAQRGLGWALYYLLKADAAAGDVPAFTAHLEELMGLDALDAGDDAMLFDNVLWPLAGLIRQMTRDGHPDGLQHLLGLLEGREFQPSKGYSCLLRVCIAFKQWDGLAAFIEWWGLGKLLPEDYLPFKKDKVSIMSLAEQASIAYAKALLAKGDKDKIAAFLPWLERLADEHPEMTYPGYFCGKLMLSMGAARDEALRMVMPLVRRKRAEFWVWQLLAEVYEGEPDTQLACCLRAVHCKTKEDFLGKVRLKPAAAVVSCRRGGATAAFDDICRFFSISEMLIVSSNYWNQVHGNTPEEVLKDEEGIQTMRILARNMAYVIKAMRKASLPLPEAEAKIRTNFIR